MKRFILSTLSLAVLLNTYAQKFLSSVSNEERQIINLIVSDAKKGDAESQFALGMGYLVGDVIEVDYKQAEKWLKKAEAQNYQDAYEGLGHLYDTLSRNKQITQSEARSYKNLSIEYYKKAIFENVDRDKKANIAEYMVELEYHHFDLTGRDFTDLNENDQTIKIFIDGSDFGVTIASSMLGMYYDVINSYDKAMYYYTKAADNGDYDAQEILALAYYEGKEIAERKVIKDYNKAFKYLKLACTNPNEEDFRNSSDTEKLLNNLASCYRYGRGVAVNEKIADLWDYLSAFIYGNNRSNRIREIEGVSLNSDMDDYGQFREASVFLLSKFEDAFKNASNTDKGCKMLYIMARLSHANDTSINQLFQELQFMAEDKNLTTMERCFLCDYLSAVLPGDTSKYSQVVESLNVTDEELENYVTQLYKKSLLLYW